MQTFELSLSESLLLGFCAEEHRRAGPSLFEVFERRLRPFVPLLTQTKTRVAHPDDLPDDIEWYAIAAIANVAQSDEEEGSVKSRARMDWPTPVDYHILPSDSDPFDEAGAYLGRARSSPKIVFLGGDWRAPGRPVGMPADRLEDGSVVRVWWDTTRRSLIDLVLDHAYREAGARDEGLLERRAIAAEQRWLWDFANRMDEIWPLNVAPNFIEREADDLPWWPFLDGGEVRVYGLSDRLDAISPETEKGRFCFRSN